MLLRWFHLFIILLFPLVLFAENLPWENWQNLKNLARLNSDTQSLLRSSFCPYNCRFDRTSTGDTRFYRIENGEAVVFEELNPGAITRIWMTTGANGMSQDLDSNIHIKFYFDDADVAQIELPLADLFNSSVLPFIYPLVANRSNSSGGYFSYVPISYSKNLKITLTNAIHTKLWFQFNYQRMPKTTSINTFSLVSDFTEFSTLLSKAGSEIWNSYDKQIGDDIQLHPGVKQSISLHKAAGWIKRISLDVDDQYYDKIDLLLSFDGQLQSQLKLSDFFAIGKNVGVSPQSLFIGKDKNDNLYSYFPMPYQKSASLSLLLDESELNLVTVRYELGLDIDTPNQKMGSFSTQLNETCPSVPYVETPLLNVSKRGKWVGLSMELSSANTLSQDYLEGDEKVFIDGDTHPTLFGTGTEDIFNGGFYFDQGNFSLALNGSPYFLTPSSQQSIISAYRFMLTDPIEFQSSINARLENGAIGDNEQCSKSLAYYYVKSEMGFEIIDSLDLSSANSINNHNYTSQGPNQCSELNAIYLDQPPTEHTSTVCRRESGSSSFIMFNPKPSSILRLRRLIDNHFPNQAAKVFVNGIHVGTFSNIPQKPEAYIPSMPDRRWQQDSLQLGTGFADKLNIVILPIDNDNGELIFTESEYQLLAKPVDLIFKNSFQ